MAHRNEQQDSVKHATRRGAISCLGWGGRCGLLVLLGAVVLLGLGIAPAQAAPFAYITNNGSNNVSVIDTSTNTVIATVPVGSLPFGVAVHPAGTRVYVTNISSNNVSVIDTVTNTVVATVPLGAEPRGVAVHRLCHRHQH